MAAAYAFADGGQQPKELRELWLIERFGVEAIKNRSYLGAKEIKSMLLAENIYNAYNEREKSTNVAEWTQSNPDKADLVHAAYTEAVKLGLVEE
jgi:hypothetical protein